MEISKEYISDIAIVKLTDKLDAMTSNIALQTIITFIEEGDKKIILDLSQLNYISSAGLQVILQVAKKLASVDGKFALSSLPPNISDIIEISGFSDFLKIYENNKDAIQAF